VLIAVFVERLYAVSFCGRLGDNLRKYGMGRMETCTFGARLYIETWEASEGRKEKADYL